MVVHEEGEAGVVYGGFVNYLLFLFKHIISIRRYYLNYRLVIYRALNGVEAGISGYQLLFGMSLIIPTLLDRILLILSKETNHKIYEVYY